MSMKHEISSHTPPDQPEILETTSRPYHCNWCKRAEGGHSSRLWEVRAIPSYILRARIPECLILRMHRKRKYTRKLTDAEKAILCELHREGVIKTQECPK